MPNNSKFNFEVESEKDYAPSLITVNGVKRDITRYFSLDVTEDLDIVLESSPTPYRMIVSVNGSGFYSWRNSISGSGQDHYSSTYGQNIQLLIAGESVDFKLTPDRGYVVGRITIDRVVQTNLEEFKIEDIRKDVIVDIEFVKIPTA